jgi:hypothetical protein
LLFEEVDFLGVIYSTGDAQWNDVWRVICLGEGCGKFQARNAYVCDDEFGLCEVDDRQDEPPMAIGSNRGVGISLAEEAIAYAANAIAVRAADGAGKAPAVFRQDDFHKNCYLKVSTLYLTPT